MFAGSSTSLLPDRKLKTLFQRPLNHLSDTKDGYSLLLFWYWEQCLKERYIFALFPHFWILVDVHHFLKHGVYVQDNKVVRGNHCLFNIEDTF